MNAPKPIVNPQSLAAGLVKKPQFIGSVPGAPRADTSQALKQLNSFTLVLAAGVPQRLAIAGDYIYVQQASTALMSADGVGSTVQIIAVDDKGNTIILDLVGKGWIFPVAFEYISLQSTVGTIVTVIAGFGRVQNDASVRYTVGLGDTAVQTFARPANATPYAANQIVSDGVTILEFPRMARFPNGTGIITKARVVKNSTTVLNANFTLFLQQASPGVKADQSAYAMLGADQNFGSGVINFPSFVSGGAGSDSALCEVAGISVPFKCSAASALQAPNLGGGGSLFGLLVANAAYVPGNGENFRIELFTDKY